MKAVQLSLGLAILLTGAYGQTSDGTVALASKVVDNGAGCSCDCGEGYITSSGPEGCDCTPVSPIIIDLDGNGVKLTSKADGVRFDLDANGERRQLPWTAGDSRDGWLVFDWNQNGLIEDGQQLFGDQSAQSEALSPTETENGYRALRGLDDNKDGQITKGADGSWRLLGVWIDANHNGESDPGEILSLTNAGITAISLRYIENRKKDRYGNEFRYRSEVKLASGKKTLSWDVFLTGK